MQEMDQSTKQVIAQSGHSLPGFFTPERLVAIRDTFDHMVIIKTGHSNWVLFSSPHPQKNN